MKLKRVYSSIIPFKRYLAMTVFPWVFIREELRSKYTPTVNRHETTHGLQQLETLWLPFFIIYGLEYIIKLPLCCFGFDRAYKSISFEQEAFDNQGKVNYNNERKHYAWIKYIFKLK